MKALLSDDVRRRVCRDDFAECVVDAAGRFHIGNLAPGRIDLQVESPWKYPLIVERRVSDVAVGTQDLAIVVAADPSPRK